MKRNSSAHNESCPGLSHRDSRLFRYISPELVLCIGITLSVFLFITSGNMEDDRIKTEFEGQAKDRFTAFKNISDNYLQELEALEAFYAASEKVTRAEFRVFTKELLSHYNRTQALEWIPRVPDPERAAYEAEARREGLPDFQITERTALGVMVKADRRGEYFPVYFVEPFKVNEAVLGNDLASEPLRFAALNYARDTGQVTATAGIKLVQKKGGSYGILILRPVYRKGLPADSIEARRRNLEGFVLGAFRIDDLLEEAMSSFVPAGIDIYLYDISANDKENILYFHASRVRAVQTSPVSDINELTKGLHYSESFDMAGRKWLMLYIPTPDYISSRKTWDAWWFLAGGVLFTGLLAGYIRLINNQTAQARQYTAGLLKAKDEWEKTFDTIPDIVTIIDSQYRIVRANKALAQKLGVPKEELVGKFCYNLLHNTEQPPSHCPHHKTINAATEHVEEFYAENLKAYYIISSTPLFDSQGRVSGIVEIAHDITGRKRSEKALYESEKKYRDMFESATDAIFILDLDGNFIDVNSIAYSRLGYSKEEMLSMHISQLDPPQFAAKVPGRMAQLRDHGFAIFDSAHIRKDGTVMPVEVNARLYDYEGKKVYFSFIRDITERKQVENELDRSHKSLLSVLDGIEAIVYVADIQTHELLFVNQFTKQLFGDITGNICWQALQSGQSGTCSFCSNDKLLTPEGKPAGVYHWEFQNTVNGRWYDIHDRAIYWTDNRIVRLEIAIDETERKSIEDRLRASLEEKEILLREIHHRVKNNMTVIYSLLDLQSKFAYERHDRQMLNDAKARIKAMALIHEKLYRSPNLAKIDFSDYLRDILNNIFMSYVQDPGRIALKIEVHDIALVIDDAIPCGLIINELVSNTLRHAFPEGRKGEITVGMRSYDNDMIELIVEDNGIGLPSDLDSRKKASMGLGLVDALVNQLHGKIELHKEEGTRFRITFRRHK